LLFSSLVNIIIAHTLTHNSGRSQATAAINIINVTQESEKQYRIMLLNLLLLILCVMHVVSGNKSGKAVDSVAGRLVVVHTPQGEAHLRIIGDLSDKKRIPIICE
jgi:hypothetical protein